MTIIIISYFFSGILIFVILFNIFKFKKIENPLRKINFWLIFVITTFIIGTLMKVLLTFYLLFSLFSNELPRKPFNTKLWITEPAKRTEMIDDLEKRKLLNKKSKIEIIKLLGPPLDSCNYFLETKRDMIYNLGIERNPLGVDCEWLLIWLDNDTVKKYEICTD